MISGGRLRRNREQPLVRVQSCADFTIELDGRLMIRLPVWKLAIVAATSALLAACSGQNNTVTPGTAAARSTAATPASIFDGESFSSGAARSECSYTLKGFLNAKFYASGTGSGPYPGYFKQSGKISRRGPSGFVLHSHFRLRSGSKRFTGHETYEWFGNAPCYYGRVKFSLSTKYHVQGGERQGRGIATVTLERSSFSESFYGQ